MEINYQIRKVGVGMKKSNKFEKIVKVKKYHLKNLQNSKSKENLKLSIAKCKDNLVISWTNYKAYDNIYCKLDA